MSEYSRTIQIRAKKGKDPSPIENQGLLTVTRVQKGDRVWFLEYTDNGEASLEAKFPEGSPFGDVTAVKFEKMTDDAHDGNGEGKGVEVKAPPGDKLYKYELHLPGKPTGLIAGQIDIDP